MTSVKVTGISLLVSAPEWFDREDFIKWRNNKINGPAVWFQDVKKRTATNGEEFFDEDPDTFVVFESISFDVTNEEYSWEGPSSYLLPYDIYQDIGKIIHDAYSGLPPSNVFGIIWISPI